MMPELLTYIQQEIEIFGDELAFDRSQLVDFLKIENKPVTELSDSISEMDELVVQVRNCRVCAETVSRIHLVFGDGKQTSPAVIIGHFPSANDDISGNTFSGPAGELLDKMLAAIGLSRNDLYLCNLLKCKPETPKVGHQARACRSFLLQQLEILQPKLILCMGEIVGQSLLKTRDNIQDLRQKEFTHNNAKVIVTYHPADLIADSNFKRPAWVDLQKFKEYYTNLEN